MDDTQPASELPGPQAQLGNHSRATDERLRSLVEQADLDRKLLAYEVHDGILQDLVGAQMMVESLLGELDASEPIGRTDLERLRDLLGKALQEGRRILRQLRPLIIDERGVVHAIHSLVHDLAAREAFQVNFTCEDSLPELNEVAQNALYRIVQESLNNALRHSGIDHARVHLATVGPTLVATVEDQGVGFDRSQVPPDHWGLLSIEDRGRMAGGSATIRSAPGQGTQVTVQLPGLGPHAATD